MDDTNVEGHVPRKISYVCNIFLLHSGSIICQVTGPRQHLQDLEQGRLDVPCIYKFFLKDCKLVKVSRRLLKIALFATADITRDKLTGAQTSLSSGRKESHAGVVVSSTSPSTESTAPPALLIP